MEKREYTHLKAVEGLILSMREDGMNLREIADELGLSHKQILMTMQWQNISFPF